MSPLAAALGLAALAAGCGRDDVAHYRVPKVAPSSPPSMAGGMGANMGGGAPAGLPPPSAPAGGSRLAWTLPGGWTQESGGGGMRYATLKAPVAGKVDVSVTVLPGDAGGELANVNRWRNQIGLPPIEEGELAKARKPVTTAAGPISLYDFSSEAQGKRLVAGLGVVDGNAWFVKMTGEATAVGQARTDFLAIVGSLRRE